MGKIILGSGVRDRIEFPGIEISSYRKSEDYSNIMVKNADQERKLKVFIGLSGNLSCWSASREILPGQLFKFRKLPVATLSIEWFHL